MQFARYLKSWTYYIVCVCVCERSYKQDFQTICEIASVKKTPGLYIATSETRLVCDITYTPCHSLFFF